METERELVEEEITRLFDRLSGIEATIAQAGRADGRPMSAGALATLASLERRRDELREMAEELACTSDEMDSLRARITQLEARLAEREGEIARLKGALVQHNELLRSASSIAFRDGADTNWQSFRGQCTYTLAEYHSLVNEARTALSGASSPEGGV